MMSTKLKGHTYLNEPAAESCRFEAESCRFEAESCKFAAESCRFEAAGLLKYVWPFSGHRALKGYVRVIYRLVDRKFLNLGHMKSWNRIFLFLIRLMWPMVCLKGCIFPKECTIMLLLHTPKCIILLEMQTY